MNTGPSREFCLGAFAHVVTMQKTEDRIHVQVESMDECEVACDKRLVFR